MAHWTLGDYLRLIKSGIIIGNSMHYTVGVLIAVPLLWSDIGRAAIGLVGTVLLIASACMVNNWLDRNYDKSMKRTAVRVTARGDIRQTTLYVIAGILLLVGVALLWWLVNPLTAILGVIAWLSYSLVYTLSKPRTAWSTIIGTVPGALPAVAGYTAVTGQLSIAAWLLGALIVAWQLPHFYAIAVYRRPEYAAARVRVLSTIVSSRRMRQVIVGTIALYVLAAGMMVWLVMHWAAGVVLVAIAVLWLVRSLQYSTKQHEQWARQMFGWSMYVSLGLVVAATLHFALMRWVVV